MQVGRGEGQWGQDWGPAALNAPWLQPWASSELGFSACALPRCTHVRGRWALSQCSLPWLNTAVAHARRLAWVRPLAPGSFGASNVGMCSVLVAFLQAGLSLFAHSVPSAFASHRHALVRGMGR